VSGNFVAVQRTFRRKFGRRGPPEKSIRRWYEQFRNGGCICHQGKGHAGRPSVTKETADRVRETFTRNPRKSVRRASRELMIPERTVRKILRKRLQLYLQTATGKKYSDILYSPCIFVGLVGWGVWGNERNICQ
jgi:hypothetical protein